MVKQFTINKQAFWNFFLLAVYLESFLRKGP